MKVEVNGNVPSPDDAIDVIFISVKGNVGESAQEVAAQYKQAVEELKKKKEEE